MSNLAPAGGLPLTEGSLRPVNSRELLEEYASATPQQIARVEAALEGRSDAELNRSKNGEWSPYRVIEHLVLSNAPYVEKLRMVIDATPKSDDLLPVRHSWLGRMLIKGAGPSGNAPAPKPLVPGPGPYTRDVFDRWKAQQEQMLGLAKSAAERDLSSIRLANPFLKFLKMNVADCFAIFKEHTERHVRQIEERVRA